ncbi:MAG: hypothetical protein JRN52_11125 [Nitrososphaerota archaeon]|nr:hypothetical protein [Nitrososphaerota archaeon]
MKRSSLYASLDEKERQRLKDLGLEECKSASACYDIISKMRMRHLDQTKMMLTRIAQSSDLFSEEIQRGIVQNNLEVFAKAVSMLLFEE